LPQHCPISNLSGVKFLVLSVSKSILVLKKERRGKKEKVHKGVVMKKVYWIIKLIYF
jgi:hypothetical protein